ncbi:MAG: hypothetical protein WC280_03820 [Patescibacteria group bacterium]
MGNRLGDFFNKKPEEIKKEIESEKTRKELANLGYSEKGRVIDEGKLNYDPINKKNYILGKESFLIEDAEIYSDEKIKEYIDLLGDNYNKIQERLNYNEDNKEIPEIKIPEYSQEEKKFLSKASREWLENKKITLDDGSEISKKNNPEYESRVIEMIKEFRDFFPEDYIKIIDRKIITKELADFKWEEEAFNGKNLMVSCYPNKEETKIKYINSDYKFKNLDQVFVSSSKDKNGKIIKNKDGQVLVFCEAPYWYKKQTKKVNQQKA